MKLCFRSDEPTGGLGHSDQGAVFGLLRPDTASRMLVTQLLVLGDLFVRALALDFVVLVLSPPRRTVLSETVLVLDGCLNCCDAARRSKRFAGTCGPIGRIAILGRFEYEYREAEYEYEKKHEQSIGPKCSIGRF
jgi:hypothetical protein